MIWLVMICAGMLTFGARYSMIGLFGNRPIPDRLRRLLAYIGPAVMAAIIAPEVILIDGAIAFTDNPKIPAFIAATVIAVLTRNVLATIATGMLLLWVLMGSIF